MGSSFSRLALAVALALATGVHAAEQFDEFYVEIKGPDGSAQPAPSPLFPNAKPAVPAPAVQTVKPGPKPGVRRQAAASLTTYGPVRRADTLWSIANQVQPNPSVSVYQTALAIYHKNPGAFARGNLNAIYSGVRLQLPTLDEIRREDDAAARKAVRTGRVESGRAARNLRVSSPAANAVVANIQPEAEVPTPKAEVPSPEVKSAPLPEAVVGATVISAEAAATSPTAIVPAPQVSVAKAAEAVAEEPQAPVVDEIVKRAVTAPEPDSPLPATEAAAMAQEDPTAGYESEIARLSENNNKLKVTLEQVTGELAQLKGQLEEQAQLKQQLVELQAAAEVNKQETKGVWQQLLASPLNLGLILLLPVLLVLALVSLWLRARAVKELKAREQELAESTSSLLEQEQDAFDGLLAAGVMAADAVPDLHQQDETLEPQPQVDIGADAVVSASPQMLDTQPLDTEELVPEPPVVETVKDDALDLDFDELDLSMPDNTADYGFETAAPVEADNKAAAVFEDDDFLAQLGIGESSETTAGSGDRSESTGSVRTTYEELDAELKLASVPAPELLADAVTRRDTELELAFEPEPVIEPEPAAEPEVLADTPGAEASEFELAFEPGPVVEPEPASATEPKMQAEIPGGEAAEFELAFEPEPVVELEPAPAAEPKVLADTAARFDAELGLAFESEPVVEPESEDLADSADELGAEFELAFEPEPESKLQPEPEWELPPLSEQELDLEMPEDLATLSDAIAAEAAEIETHGRAFESMSDRAPLSAEERHLRELAAKFASADPEGVGQDEPLPMANWYDESAELAVTDQGAQQDHAHPTADDLDTLEEGFLDIDALLAESDLKGETESEAYQGFSLDVGLDEFPEVLPKDKGIDVDADEGGVGAKLDLARAYLEIDDKASARELLEEALAEGSQTQQSEAQKLLKRLS